MPNTISEVFKAIKAVIDESGSQPVLVLVGGTLESGKTTFCDTMKKLFNNAGYTGAIVEQGPNCNKHPADLSRSLEQAFRTKKTPAEIKLDNDISATSVELTKLTNKLKGDNNDTEKYEELSQTQIDLNTRLVALKNSRAELKTSLAGTPKYVNDVVLIDRTQILKVHRNQITDMYFKIFGKEFPESNCIGVNMVTSVETCVARSPKSAAFITDLYNKYEPMAVDQGYAYVFDIDGVTPNTTELKTVKPRIKPTKPTTRRTTAGSGGGGNAWTNKTILPTAEQTPVVVDHDPFESVDPAPETSPNTTEIKMMGFVLGLSATQRTGLLATLEELKKKGILGVDALTRPVKYCSAISCRRTTDELTVNSFRNVPMPGTSVAITFYAYVCDSNLGCLTARIEDTVNFVKGRAFLPVDLAIGNNGNASKMLTTKTGTRYPIDPITVEMTVGIQIRNPDLTTSTVYDVGVLGPNMFTLLSRQ